jgi:hypothetical protein
VVTEPSSSPPSLFGVRWPQNEAALTESGEETRAPPRKRKMALTAITMIARNAERNKRGVSAGPISALERVVAARCNSPSDGKTAGGDLR